MEDRNIVVRAAGHDDYKAVIDISKGLCNGRDYLHVKYHILLQDKNSNCFVILLNGRIVGFQNNYIVDGGTRYVKMNLRIAEDSRGMGLGKVLGKESQVQTIQKHPSLKCCSWSTINYPTERTYKFKELLKWTGYAFNDVFLDEMQHFIRDVPQHVPLDKISQLNLSQSYKILTDPTNQKQLFPDSYFTASCFWFPYLVNDKNLKEAAMKNNVRVSFGPDGSTCESVAFHSLLPIENGGLRSDLFIYGSTVTANQVLAHVYFTLNDHFKNVNTNRELKWCLFFPKHVDKEAVLSQLLPGLGVREVDTDFIHDESVILAKDIQ